MAGPFELALSEFAAKAGDRADQAIREVVLTIQGRITSRIEIPVDTGRLRQSFFYGLDAAPQGVPPEVPKGTRLPAPAPFALTPGTGAGRVHYIVSNLVYAWPMEARFGFVGLTALEFAPIVDEAVRKVAP